MGKTEQKSKTELRLEAYQQAINRIDDWFEYEMLDAIAPALGVPAELIKPNVTGQRRSYQEAREFVYNTLDKLTEELCEIKKG